MKFSKLNAHFDSRSLLTRSQYELYIQGRRVFKTRVQFTPAQALTHVRPLTQTEIADHTAGLLQDYALTPAQLKTIFTPGGLYHGYVFTETGTWEEARQLATERGLGENVISLLGAVAQLRDERNDLIARLAPEEVALLTAAVPAEQLAVQSAEELTAAHKEQLRACWHAAGMKTIGFEPYDTVHENTCFEQWYASQYAGSELPSVAPLP